jgi:hypothetical protein
MDGMSPVKKERRVQFFPDRTERDQLSLHGTDGRSKKREIETFAFRKRETVKRKLEGKERFLRFFRDRKAKKH